MGNTCGKKGLPRREESPEEKRKTEDELMEEFYGTELHFLPYQERRAQLEEWLRDIQKHNRERLRKEMLADLHTFILNNVLLCVQFYENFDRAAAAAKEFKKSTEAEMTENLGPLAEDGMILGERKCMLISGMGQQVAQNYVYKDDGHMQKKSASGGGRDGKKKHVSIAPVPEKSIGESDEPRSTFTCDNILPLEFVITWDNLEVYTEPEWDGLREYQYASAKGSPSICRVCVEETDEKNEIPKGFVRVRVVDTPLSLRPGHPLPISMDHAHASSPSGSAGYATGEYSMIGENDEFRENVDEVQTESDCETEDGHSDLSAAYASGKDFLNARRNRMESSFRASKTLNNFSFSKPLELSKDEKPSFNTRNLKIDGNSGRLNAVVPQRYQQVIGELSQQKTFPKVTVSRAEVSSLSSPEKIPISRKSKTHRFETKSAKPSLQPLNSGLLTPSSALAFRKSRSLPSLAPPNVGNGAQTSSSGYESTSPTPPPPLQQVDRSHSSSTTSVADDDDDIRNKWQQVELKRLWQFVPKRRPKATQSLSESCFQKIQIEVDSDEDEVLEIISDSSDSDDTESDASSTNGRPKDLSEPKYEDRTYLNSVGFSADFCSEFKQVGKQLSIAEGPLRSAVILGATVRCAVASPFGTADENVKPSTSRGQSAASKKVGTGKHNESATTLYTFTPSLYGKSWPLKPLIRWQKRMIHDVWEGSEKWPTREQVERIEQAGCNLIPLGNRSITSTAAENVRQTLVWSVGFAAGESILLDSLLHVQWRCLNFSSIIFRAFLAPLGPLGIGLEHFRNILYFMCHEEFLSWNYEQPGVHVRALLDRLYDCLGRGDMPNFFITQHNLFKNIPVQNLRKVQAYLNKVRDNLLFYTIFMLRNLVQVKDNKDFYPMPRDHFRKLYDYLTVSETRILYFVNPDLYGKTTEDVKKESEKKRRKREKKEINQALLMNGELIDNAYDHYVKGVPKFRQVDQQQRKLQRKRERWMEKQKKIKDLTEEKAKNAKESEKLPQEKKNSIDLEKLPLKQRQFSAQRLGLVLKYFIKHFIKMSAKSYEFKSYAQASMYAQHVENLISFLADLPNEEESIEKFKEDSKVLRDTIGAHMIDYIQEKISRIGQSTDEGGVTKTFDQITSLLSNPGNADGAFSNNWDLRTLPTPPDSEFRSGPSGQFQKGHSKKINLSSKNMARSLASLSVSSMSQVDGRGGSSGEFHLPRVARKNYRRGPGLKWSSNPAIHPTSRIYLPQIPPEVDGNNFMFGSHMNHQ